LSPKVHNIGFAKSFVVNQPTNPSKNQTENNPKRTYQSNQEQLPPLPMPLEKIYAKQLSIGHATPLPFPPFKPPFPSWYKSELTYKYHARNPSHIIHLLSIQEEARAIIQGRVNNF
jgi:hypothetical protein